MSREEFRRPVPRPGVLEQLAKEAPKYRDDPRRVLLCFGCDPYQHIEQYCELTRQALEILYEHRVLATILTKNPQLALKDLELLVRGRTHFGATIVFTHEAWRETWEPCAPSIESRIQAVRDAHDSGLYTWISLEPVIDPPQAFGVIRRLLGHVEHWKIGKVNHNPELEATVNWTAFRAEITGFMDLVGADYYIKQDLRDA